MDNDLGQTLEIDAMVQALKKVPTKKLMIIDLANSIPIINGDFNSQVLLDRQSEINLAIQEASFYGTAIQPTVTSPAGPAPAGDNPAASGAAGEKPAAQAENPAPPAINPAAPEEKPAPAAGTQVVTAGKPAQALAAPTQSKNSSEIKVVITLKDGKSTVGIKRTGCDPVFFVVPGSTIPAVMTAMPGLLVQASKKWAAAPKAPASPTPPAVVNNVIPDRTANTPKPAQQAQIIIPGI